MGGHPGLEFVDIQPGRIDDFIRQARRIGEESALLAYPEGDAALGRQGIDPAGLPIPFLDNLVRAIEKEHIHRPAFCTQFTRHRGKAGQETLFTSVQGQCNAPPRPRISQYQRRHGRAAHPPGHD